MRTMRTQRSKPRKAENEIVIAENATFSVFEDFEPKTVQFGIGENGAINPPDDDQGWQTFPTYIGDAAQVGDQLGSEGVAAVRAFAEGLSAKRYDCEKGTHKGFYLDLAVNEQPVQLAGGIKLQVVTFWFHAENVGTADKPEYIGRADLYVDQESGNIRRTIKNMLVDSNTNDGLVRFVAENAWEAPTYAILDANENLNIFKNVHLTLNAPFNCNMKWYVPNRKLVYGYKIREEEGN